MFTLCFDVRQQYRACYITWFWRFSCSSRIRNSTCHTEKTGLHAMTLKSITIAILLRTESHIKNEKLFEYCPSCFPSLKWFLIPDTLHPAQQLISILANFLHRKWHEMTSLHQLSLCALDWMILLLFFKVRETLGINADRLASFYIYLVQAECIHLNHGDI